MLCSGEKMGNPSTNEWPQMGGGGGGGDSTSAPATASASASATTTRVMEALKCPRCDSSNTKFCYYNNYSLSQPRHFCKACKRYWTRGGTLRNVPVGGGCRKNKRSKKPSSSSSSDPPPLPPPIPSLNLPNPSSADLNSFFYGLPNTTTTSSDMNLNSSFPNNIHVPCTAYDLQPQMSSLALLNPSNNLHDDEYPSGFGNHLAQLQHEYSLFGSSLSSSTVASLLVSSLKHQQPKKMDELQAYLPYQDLQANGSLGFLKQVKAEGEEANAMMSNNNYNYNNRMEWQVQAPFENPFDTISSAAAQEPSSLYWNSAIGAWPDATNCGSSVAPLI